MDPLRDLKAKSPALKPRTIDDVPGDDAFDALKADSPFAGVLAKIVEADLPGVSLTMSELTPDSLVFGPYVQNPRSLLKAGLQTYANQQTGVAAVYNPQVLSREEVAAVDQAGKLPEILPPVASLLGSAPTAAAEPAPETPAPEQVAPTGTPAPRARAAETRPIAEQRARQPKSEPAGPAGGSILSGLLRKPL